MFRLARMALVTAVSITGLAACFEGNSDNKPPPPNAQWKLVETSDFSLLDEDTLITRTQGLAYDPASESVIFSGGNLEIKRFGLATANLGDYGNKATNTDAIPAALRDQYGSNHIGCVDVLQGEILAPLEDASNYQNSIIAKFSMDKLSYTEQFALLPHDSSQDDGVPWVAANPLRNVVYTMKFNNATMLNIFALDSLWSTPNVAVTRQGQLQISESLSAVQCAKVNDKGDTLYVFLDDSQKSVKSIDLNNGQVTHILSLADYVDFSNKSIEAEGLAFYPRGNGSTLHLTATVTPNQITNPFVPHVAVYDFKFE